MVAPITLEQMPIPTESIAKLGHHVSEHTYEHEHKPTFRQDGHLNPIAYAISHSWKAAAWGAAGLLGFTGLLKGSLMLAEHLLPAAMVASGAGTLVAAAIGIGIAGAVWYGASAFMKAYNIAQEHNQGFAKHLDDRFQSHMKEHQKEKPRGRELPRRTLAGAEIVAGPIGLPQHEQAPIAAQPEQAAAHQSAPRHVQKILDDGPRTLSPKEYAQRIHEQRTAAKEASL